MKNKSIVILFLFAYLFIHTQASMAAIPSGYYNQIEGKSSPANILQALYNTISSHTNVGYDGLYTVYPTSDVIPGTNQVWDMYSTCSFTHGQKKCGSYQDVCDCYNREHSIPQSWFGEAQPMKSDAFHVIPTDGKVNGQRSNYPLGECANGTKLSSKALGRLGTSTFSGYSGKVFEVDDQYKGDFARAYFYMVACYYNRNFTSGTGNTMFTYTSSKAGLTTYATNLLLKWHRQDPVSQKEIDRNNAIYAHQNNRNPFIDYPCLAEYIWGTAVGSQVHLATLNDCNGGIIDTTIVDTTSIDVTTFQVLPVTNIHATSATLNWTNANVASYTVDVYTKTTNGSEEQTILTDQAGALAQISGYSTDTEVNGYIRLGSGSNTGSLTYNNLDFSLGGQIRVQAYQYNNDNGAQLRIVAGTSCDTFTTTQTPTTYTLTVEPQSSHSSTLVIETLIKKSRVYVGTVDAIAGGEVTTIDHIQGYPINVGNVLSHTVTNLEENEQYFYTITPDGMIGSEEESFVTEEGWNGTSFVTFPTLDWHIISDGVMLVGIPKNTYITLYDCTGRLVEQVRNIQDSSYTLPLSKGIYLIHVRQGGKSQTIKLIF